MIASHGRRQAQQILLLGLLPALAWPAGCASHRKRAITEDPGAPSPPVVMTDAPAGATSDPATSADAASAAEGLLPQSQPVQSTADMLARKAESYAQSLEPMLEHRNAEVAQAEARAQSQLQAAIDHPADAGPDTAAQEARGNAPVSARPAPSVVQWMDPKQAQPLPAGPGSEKAAPDGRVIPAIAPADESTIAAHVPDAAAPADQRPQAVRVLPDSGPPAVNPVQPTRIDEGRLSAAAQKASASPVNQPAVVSEVAPGAKVPLTTAAETGDDADGLMRRFSQRIKDFPRDPAAHLDYQVLRFLRDESVPDLNAIASLPAEDREMLTILLDGLSNFRTQLRADSNMLLSKKVAPLIDMADRLRSRSDLNIPKIAICREVRQFGVYEPIEPARFISDGTDHEIIVYCEIANFRSQLNDRALWETKLNYSASLFTETEAGLEVWQSKPADILDICRNRRHDFFIADKIKLPANLLIGGYLLKVTIIDQNADRIAEASVPIQIVAR